MTPAGHRLSALALAILTASSFILGGCETMKGAADKITSRDGDNETLIGKLEPKYVPSKLAIGQQKDLMHRRTNSFGTISTPELTRYLNGIRTNLLRHAGVSDVPGEVYVTADEEFNAEATPDGNIFINWQLLSALNSEDAVASVIAHELAHVLLRHNDSNLIARYQRSAQYWHGQGVLRMAAARTLASNGQKQGLKKGEISQFENLQLLVNLTTKVAAPSWQRSQERSADLLGIDLMIRAGYNPDGMTDMLSVLKNAYENDKKDPNPVDVVNLAGKLALGNTQQKLGAGIELLAKTVGNDHPDPQTRIDDTYAYVSRHYDDAATSGPFRRKSWENIRKSPQLQKLLAAYEGANSAFKEFNNKKPREAYARSSKYLDGARNHPYPVFVHAVTLYGINKSKEGDNVLRAVLNSSTEPSGKVYNMLAENLEAQGRNREALDITTRGYERLGQPPQLLPKLVHYQRLNGDSKRASQTADFCAREHNDFRDQCYQELNAQTGATKTASR